MEEIFNKLKKIFENKKIYIPIIVFIWIFLFVGTIYFYRSSLGKVSYGNKDYDFIEILNSNDEIKQIVDCNNEIDAIAIRFEIFKKNKSKVTVEVIGNDSNNIYGKKDINCSNILGASFNTISLDKKTDISKDKTISVIVKTNDNEKAIGVWCSNNDVFNNVLSKNNSKIEGSLSLRLLSSNRTYATLSKTIIFSLFILLSLLIFIELFFEIKKEYIYTAVLLIFGFYFLIILTPFSGPDEVYHYERSLVFSNKMMGKDPYLIEEVYINNTGYNFETDHSDGKEYSIILENINKPLVDLNDVEKVEIEKDYVYWYDLCYTPYSLGITIARLFKANPLITYYMGGLFGLISYAICIYFAIKISTMFKDMIGAISLLPVCLQQTTIYSSDLLIISMCILLFAYLMKWYCSKEKISKLDYVVVFVINALLAPDKAIYSLVVLLFFFVPKDKFNSNKERIIVMLLLIAPVFYQFAEQFLTRYPIFNTIFAEDGVNYGDIRVIENLFTLEYALGHIPETIAIILRTILYEFKDWIVGSLGRYLSNLNLILPSISAYIYLLLLLVASLFKEEETIDPKLKISSLFISGIIVMMTIVYMLVGWTDISDTYIQGIQGRYFTPLLPFIFLIFNNKKVSVPKYLDKAFIFAQILIGFETLIFIFSYTFVY